ncbi:sphingomyelin phosphodiesterase 4 isoform X1 [Drosophila grimshawi]|uniref:GH18779 n=2 Tax=Drosophila grimshawi TaxID=7222 RepID=B4JG09_DROGR|nr:sphingomyelin phosphodiesterase 4 isoform X1 [Drosophila grimshawi]EDV92548.1 GH18779 [Drosophila grimshawi]
MYQPMPPENLNSHILTVLGLPLLNKLQQLEILFERCTVRQIQEIYPLIVHSIFGINGNPLGWGLRITTMENASHSFNRLQHFFGVNGIWMHVCHRLLNETTKFDIDIHLLPRKFIGMLQAGPMFYADLINIDPLKHQVSTLSLNAFDFYIFHFALYALQPLHTINPIAMQIHNERTKTIYQYLATEYLDNFLPQYPDASIEPSNFSSSVKAPQQMPVQALQPQRKLRYLKLPSSYRNGNNNASGAVSGNTSPQSVDSSDATCRAHVWRSESVLHFFVDIWLRYDIESEHHLPSSDFVRGVRTLVKQIHFFANAAHVDHSPLCALRKQSLTMVKVSIYGFLCSLIDRWPLDSSLSVVLELWLSYIQPWRYTLGSNNHRTVGVLYEPPITNAFDGFIMDNLIVYTHIFMLLLPRFERLDYTVYRNAYMLHRLVKTFSQQDLVQRLQRFERLHTGHNYGVDSPQRQVNMLNKSLNNSYNAQWNPSVSSDMPKLFSESMHMKIHNFLYLISMVRNSVLTNIISALRKEILERQRSEGYLKNLFKKFIGESSQDELTLRDISRIPEVLRQCIDAFCRTFDVDQESLSMHESLQTEASPTASPSSQNFSFFDPNNSINSSKLTPMQMSLNASNMLDTVDPALLPIKSNEIKPLVKVLHIISESINERFGSRLEACYEREDFFGKLARQMLCAPMTEKWFEKSSGNVEFYEKQLPARVSLRPLASISSLCLMAISLCFGHFWCGFPSVGILILCVVFLMYRILLAVLS